MFRKVKFLSRFQTENLQISSCCRFLPSPLDIKTVKQNILIRLYMKLNFIGSFQNKVCVCYNMKVSCLIKLFNFSTEI